MNPGGNIMMRSFKIYANEQSKIENIINERNKFIRKKEQKYG